MHITFFPIRSARQHSLEKQGDSLIIDGVTFDFSGIPEGGTLPADAVSSHLFCGPVERTDGQISLSLLLPHGAVAPQTTRFAEPVEISEDGPILLPVYEEPSQEED